MLIWDIYCELTLPSIPHDISSTRQQSYLRSTQLRRSSLAVQCLSEKPFIKPLSASLLGPYDSPIACDIIHFRYLQKLGETQTCCARCFHPTRIHTPTDSTIYLYHIGRFAVKKKCGSCETQPHAPLRLDSPRIAALGSYLAPIRSKIPHRPNVSGNCEGSPVALGRLEDSHPVLARLFRGVKRFVRPARNILRGNVAIILTEANADR